MLQSRDPDKQAVFAALFPLFRKMVDACPNSAPTAWQFYAKAIPIKIFRQTCTLNATLNRVPVPFSEGETMGDPDSVHVIARSILESYLVFHHIFVASEDEPEREFWYLAWVLRSLTLRVERMHANSDALPSLQKDPETGADVIKSGKDVRDNMRKNAEEIREVLKENEFYKKNILIPEKEKRFREYVTKGWESSPTHLLGRAKMHFYLTRSIYAFLSSSAHTDHIDVKQTAMPKTQEQQADLAELSISIVITSIARLCLELPSVFPDVHPLLEADQVALTYALAYKEASELEADPNA